jgi:shikimate kinase
MTPTLLTSPDASTADAGRPHTILVGLPGAGKSTAGLALAERLGRPFLDFDREIERREGSTVAELFARLGEPLFRERERELTRELAGYGDMVLSPGGGWIANPGAVGLLRPPSRLIYLKVRPTVALARLARDPVVRPLLRGPDPALAIGQLYRERAPLYETADHVIDTELFDTKGLVDNLAALASGYRGR